MDIVLEILYLIIVLSVLVFIHEGGHYLAARACGVRVTEFMLGLPGPSIGFTHKETRFGLTAVPLGGYAKVCGMEAGPENPHIEHALAFLYRNGTVYADDFAEEEGISVDDAVEVMYILEEWGCAEGPRKSDQHNIFRTRALRDKKRGIDCKAGVPIAFDDAHELYLQERAKTYRAQSFGKRCFILLAGIAMNLLFVILVFILVYSVIGIDYTFESGVTRHITVPPDRAIIGGFAYIGMVVQAVVQLFDPSTAANTISNSTSVVGMAVISKEYADAGLEYFLMFMAIVSASLGIMNLLPIPPLDGGRFVVEIWQKISKKVVGQRAMNRMSIVGFSLLMVLFVVMLNQDVQRFVFGNW